MFLKFDFVNLHPNFQNHLILELHPLFSPYPLAGFSLGSTMQSHTKGMWMWCVPHPKKPDRTLVLLDTEGLGDVQKLDRKRDDFCNQNLKASEDHCSALLKDIFSPLEEDMKQGIYLKPGGYCLFPEKMQELKKYFPEPKKGIQAEEILQEYLKSKESVTDVILQTDQTLSEKEKLIEGIDCDMVPDIEVFTILKGTDLVPLNLGQLEIVSSPLGLKIQSVKLKQQLYNLTSFVTCDIYFQRSFFRVKAEAICGKMREEQLQTAL
ncbi:hypothetical protein MJT46_001319 [Ovis ammon polii x Ovis aries]|nr:hypothetical protein MJT46_001319 [Ovis ammon polii x Ovis aries]